MSISPTEWDQPEIQQNYIRMQNEMQTLAGKIGELEQQADEHRCVYTFIFALRCSDLS